MAKTVTWTDSLPAWAETALAPVVSRWVIGIDVFPAVGDIPATVYLIVTNRGGPINREPLKGSPEKQRIVETIVAGLKPGAYRRATALAALF